MGHFERSLLTEDQSLGQKASYNTGNAKYKYGISKEDTDLPAAVSLLKESLRHYQSALEAAPEDEDAKYNYQFVKKELERLQKKLKQQQKQQQKEQAEKEREKEKQQTQEEKGRQKQKEEKKEEKKSERAKQEAEQPQEAMAPRQAGEPVEPAGGMSEEEASMLLENYRQEEEPKGLYKEKIPTRGMPEVLRDW